MKIIPSSSSTQADDRDVAVVEPEPAATRAPRERVAAPERPSVRNAHGAPVITRRPPPFSVRLSEFLWILALLAGALTVVYYFVIRKDQTPLISAAIKAIQIGRPDATYDSAADIVYWTVFWVAAVSLVVQIALLVSFMSRKHGARWWQLGTVLLQALVYVLGSGLVAVGDKGDLLRSMFLAQVSLAALALLVGSFSGALAWSARRHDIRRAGDGDGADL